MTEIIIVGICCPYRGGKCTLASVSFGPLVTALVNELAGQSGEDDLLLILDPARGS